MNQDNFSLFFASRQPVPGHQGRSGTGEARPQMDMPTDKDFSAALLEYTIKRIELLAAVQ